MDQGQAIVLGAEIAVVSALVVSLLNAFIEWRRLVGERSYRETLDRRTRIRDGRIAQIDAQLGALGEARALVTASELHIPWHALDVSAWQHLLGGPAITGLALDDGDTNELQGLLVKASAGQSDLTVDEAKRARSIIDPLRENLQKARLAALSE